MSPDILLFDAGDVDASAEYRLGLRELRRRLPADCRWHVAGGGLPRPAEFPGYTDAEHLLVILNPCLVVSDLLLSDLEELLAGDGIDCALPADPRTATGEWQIDYASRPGFDRYAARRRSLAAAAHDGRVPWLYLVKRRALAALAAGDPALGWDLVPARLGSKAMVAERAFVHSFADYRQSDRSEMLELVPASTNSLLDVGGGEGGFALGFARRRDRPAALAEPDHAAATRARERGLEVHCTAFEALDESLSFDCISFLDVLEHLADPLAALLKARRMLNPGGTIVMSAPNVGHWSVVWDLLEGHFDYQPVGILCTTHLRFFSRHGLERLIDEAGLAIIRWENSPSPIPGEFARLLQRMDDCNLRPDRDSLGSESFHVLVGRR